MTDATKEQLIARIEQIKNLFHNGLISIREDLHMGDHKSALVKINEMIKMVEVKVPQDSDQPVDQ